jgi:hypothetical protein
MRRWLAVLACAALLLTGCARLPAGVDGRLTDDWAPLPAGQQFRPAAATCHAEMRDTATVETYAPVPCSGKHAGETYYVGELAGSVATAGAAAARPWVFAECSRRATAFAGADWRTGWLVVQTVLPGKDGWAGGARWFRCDLGELSPASGDLILRQGSLRRAMITQDQLALRCFNPVVSGPEVSAMRPAACAGRHTAEFAGLWIAPAGDYAKLTTARIEKGCDSVIADFAAIPDDADLTSRTGWLGFPSSETSWLLGDRSVQCFLWLNGEKMTGSYRRAGTGKLKIHYTGR